MNDQQTPAPWRITQRRNGNRDNFVVAPADRAYIAILPFLEHDRNEQETNARLIAAAPELLFAARKAIEYFDVWSVEKGPAEELLLQLLNATIAKAEGR